MSYKLSNRSKSRLEGVHPDLVETVHKAIKLTKVDFGVTAGVRTLEKQRELFAAGSSHTMNSKHLIQPTGYSHAVDLVAYVGSDISWKINLYDDIAMAMAEAANEVGCKLTWGAAWSIKDITSYVGTMEQAMNEYIDLRRSQGRRPFIDAPHYQLLQ